MQRGIDSYFSKANPAKPSAKRRAPVLSSDDELEHTPAASSQVKDKTRKITSAKKIRTEACNKIPQTNKPSLSKLKVPAASPSSKLKPVNAHALFGGESVRIEKKKLPRPNKDKELWDESFDESILNSDVLNCEQELKANGSTKLSPVKPKKFNSEENDNSASTSKNKTPVSAKKRASKQNEFDTDVKTPKRKKSRSPVEHSNSFLSDEERHERKRMSAILYQKYKNRSSVINPGSKEIPKGKPNCLAGLSFLVTGVLESLERDEAVELIKQYGGKSSTTVGKKLNYLVAGEEAGPKKLAVAEELGIPIISEDELFDLIREKSGEKNVKTISLKQINIKKEKETSLLEERKIKKEKEREDSGLLLEETKIKKEKENEVAFKQKGNSEREDSELLSKAVAIKKENQVSKMENKNFFNVKDNAVQSEDILAWVDKYKPTSLKEVIGQQGASSNCIKLSNWLSKWYENQSGKKKHQKPNPWAKNDDGSYYKAALLSGPPGVGKTTTATLVCKELGFDTVEFNASDTRSKRLLKEEVSELLSNKSLHGYINGNARFATKKHVLIMDEVDGMAGNEDRGGIQELISLIKDSLVPIICTCNDRNHPKMRSLVNYCYDLRFNKPRLEQIKGRLMSICFKEQIKLNQSKLEEIVLATNNDIRQSINHLFLLSAGKDRLLKSDGDLGGEKTAMKNLKIGPWEVVRKVFSAEEHQRMSLHDKSDLFFHDYNMAPLFVHQNYLQVTPKGPKSQILHKIALTADALSLGDLVDKRIRSNAAWTLLPTQALFSSVMPGEFMEGHFTGQINFPGWLGKYSKSNKRNRLAQELHDHTRIQTSGSRLSIRLDYAPFLLASIIRPLIEKGLDGVVDSLNVLREYRLLREDIDSLIELTTWPGKKSLMDKVDSKVKAALTRTYNKEILPYSYSIMSVKKKTANDIDLLDTIEDNADEVLTLTDEENDESVENDALIKAKKASTAKVATNKQQKGASKQNSKSRNKK